MIIQKILLFGLMLGGLVFGLSPAISGEETVSKSAWEEFSLAEGPKDRPIKILTTTQIKDNQKAAIFKSYLIGKIKDEVEIILLDGDKNGLYGEAGSDFIVLGDSPYGLPMSAVVNLNNKLYEFKMAGPAKVALKPFAGKTGTVDLAGKFKAAAPLAMAVINFGNNYFDAARKNTVVPCETYSLWLGYIEDKDIHAAIRGGGMEKITVAEKDAISGQNAIAVKWGMPLRLEFESNIDEKTGKITVTTRGLKVFGSANEEYFSFAPDMLPLVEVTDASGATVNKGSFCKT